MNDLWARITAIPRASRLVDFPRKDDKGESLGQLAVRVLTQEEQMLCSAEADKLTKKLLKEMPKNDEAKRGYEDIYSNAAAVEILFRACRDKDDLEKPFFPTTQEIRQKLTLDEIGVLVNHYLSTQAELGPIISALSKEEVDAWIERLAKSGEYSPLDYFSPDALKTLVTSLVSRLSPSLTVKSLPGLPQDEPI